MTIGKKRWALLAAGLLCILLTLGGYYMLTRPYQMAISVVPESMDDPEWPSKKQWFDASEWLKSGQYIKINDFDLLNLGYIKIDDVNDFGLERQLRRAIQETAWPTPTLAALGRLDSQEFHKVMKGRLTYEYLYSTFEKETLTPTEDYFLIFFSEQGRDYEVEIYRTPFQDDFTFYKMGDIEKAGTWHAALSRRYSYRDYQAGKAVPQR
ncbi:hypothetical protein [Serratia microhaemolytica]|uniref:hypothetical protein n=1 Tax=Serratia microhaemolytica TaxID=2675110 RepID=UPI000FDE769B|nr:hypothetical protein [Serratia microhaemolytica]